MISIQKFVFNPLQENTYLVYDDTLEAVIIDPGCYERQEQQALTHFIQDKGLKPVRLLNTHCHVDHVLGNAFVKEHYGLPLEIHENDIPTLKSVEVYAPAYGFDTYSPAQHDRLLTEGDSITFGKSALQVLFVPGHAPGHVAFYSPEDKVCLSGDVLFQQSIGRTDLPGGDMATLLASIENKLFTLGDEVIIYPGHGPETSIGYERSNNPFLR